MSVTVPRRAQRFLVAIGLLGLSACADRTLGPGATPSFDFGPGHHSGHPDKPWTGSSGSAAVTAVAAYGRDGNTELTVTSYRRADTAFANPVGCIQKVQLKAFDARGRQVLVRNFNNLRAGSTWVTTLDGLRVGYSLDIQVHVGCLDHSRTDVVEAEGTVIRRTDPAITALQVAAQAVVNQPALVQATVRELNGQQGATGTCYLVVGSTLQDSVPDVALDPGDSTTCGFAPTFPAAGTVHVTVVFGNVVPRDDRLSNNAASGTIVVSASSGGSTPPTGVLQPFVVNANLYEDTAIVLGDVFAMSERYASNPTALYDTTNFTTALTGNVQSTDFEGIIYEAVPFPLTSLTVSQASGTTVYHSGSWTNIAASGSSSAGSQCADLSSGTVTLIVCAYAAEPAFPFGSTTISYARADSNVALTQSVYHVNYTGPAPTPCDPTSTDTNAPCYTLTSAPGTALAHFQSSYAINVVLETPTRRYAAALTIPLANAFLDETVPFNCSQVTVTGGDGVALLQTTCTGTQATRWRKSGSLPDLVAMTQAK